jgi:cysteine desulfuration protein SufE
VLHQGLDGATPEEVLSTPNDFYLSMGLDELVTPLRMRGMAGMLARVKRRVAEGMGAGA